MIDIEDIKRLRLEPGDMLVMQCKGVISHEQGNRLREMLVRYAPSIADRVMIIDNQISLAVVSQDMTVNEARSELGLPPLPPVDPNYIRY